MAELPEQIGDYKVVRELGRGAMGVVYLGLHPTLGREVAIKVMGRELSSDPEFLERFRREGVMAAGLRHPNIVQVYDFASRDGQYFIVMEYLGPRTLKDLLEESGQQPVDTCCQMIDELLSALALAHGKGIVHRDIKPANVILSDAGPIALTDFSVAHMKESSKLTQTGTLIGTPEYMAPEQFEGRWDGRSDLYSCGVVFYELLTGLSPFRSATMAEVMRKQLLEVPNPPSQVDFTVPEAVSQVVRKVLEKDPDLRFQSVQEMRQAIAAALQGTSPSISTGATPTSLPKARDEETVISPTGCLCSQPTADQPPGQVSTSESNVPEELQGGKQSPEPASVPRQESVLPFQPALEPPRKRPRTPIAVGVVTVLLLVLGGRWIASEYHPPAKLAGQPTPSPVDLADEPGPDWVAPPAPVSPAPQASYTPTGFVETPEPVEPSAVPSPALEAGKFPEQAVIFPGQSLGPVTLGSSLSELETRWGLPDSVGMENEQMWWAYGQPGLPECTITFNFDDNIERIEIFHAKFSVDGAGFTVGTPYDVVLKDLGDPSYASETVLDYSSRGICFKFPPPEASGTYQTSMCEAVIIYQPNYSPFTSS